MNMQIKLGELKGASDMEKEEVLRKAQSKKRNQPDEMEMDILLRANRVGLIAGLILCIIIMGIKIYLDQPYQDVYAVFCAVLCGQFLYKGIRMKIRSLVWIGAVWALTTLLLVVGYFI